MSRSLALFDFDNTLTICDSFLPFILFTAGPIKFLQALIRLGQRRLRGPIDRREAKQVLAQATLSGLSKETVQKSAKNFKGLFSCYAYNQLQIEKLKDHVGKGDRVIIVSASPRLYLEVLTEEFQVELIATELIEANGIITGEILGENCRGAEKVVRLFDILNIKDYLSVSTYGDSDGDREMLQLANNPVYRGGRGRLYLFRKFLGSLALYAACLRRKSKC